VKSQAKVIIFATHIKKLHRQTLFLCSEKQNT